MASAVYTKEAYSGLDMIVYDGTNLGAIIALVQDANVRFSRGRLFVFGELIEIGDAVNQTTGETPVPQAKISAATLLADEWQVTALEYDGNLEEVIAFVGPDKAVYDGTVLSVDGVEIEANAFVAKHPTGKLLGKITATKMGDDYTISE